eukprot:TRINITY_DN6741_c0_g1_i2.p1 TRINITY_DN6741_c0_g1~~TRINITY_DN6741_c0_g1_i2.p1  ORF type:complete len:603 (+),score=187.05 TRINITY_DN6741_c0_g1_i2:160-1968(+)
MARSSRNPWVVLVATLLVMLSAGNMYLFGTYSERMKEVLFPGDERGQRKLQTIAMVGNFATFMPLAGLWYDADLRFGGRLLVGGPVSTVGVGAVLTFAGYLGLHFIADGWSSGGIGAACAFVALWGHGASYFDAAAVTCSVKSMPSHRGLVVGLEKAFLGLAGTLITQANFALFSEDDKAGYLLFVAVFCSVPAVLSMFFLEETDPALVPQGCPTASRRFTLAFTVLSVLALSMLGVGLIRAFADDVSRTAEQLIMAAAYALVVLLFLTLLFPGGPADYGAVASEADPGQRDAAAAAARRRQRRSVVSELPSTTGIDGWQGRDGMLPETVLDETPREALRTLSFWLCFAALGIGTGGGLTMINNAAQIAKAKGADKRSSDVASSLLYVCNSFGRMTLAYLGERQSQRGWPRSIVFALTLFLHALAHGVLALPGDAVVYPGFCLAGLSYGGMQATFPPVVSELHGIRYFASNYMCMMLAPSIGSAIFSNLLASSVYEKYQELDEDSDSSTYGDYTCIGDRCFLLTHILVLAACLAGVALCAVLACRTHRRRRRTVARLSAVLDVPVKEQDAVSGAQLCLPLAEEQGEKAPAHQPAPKYGTPDA